MICPQVNLSNYPLFFLHGMAEKESFMQITLDGILPTEDFVHDDTSPTRPRTRSQVKKMAELLQEGKASTNGFTSFKVSVLCIRFPKLHCSLWLTFLHFWNPFDVVLQVHAWVLGHNFKRIEDQGHFPSYSIMPRFCTVGNIRLVNPQNHFVTLIFLRGGILHILKLPPTFKITTMVVFPM